MDWGYTLLITSILTFLYLLVQRTESSRKRITFFLAALITLIIRHNAFLRGDVHEETLFAFITALILTFLFWLLIGRYNPVGSSDNIKVMGLDD